MESIPVVLCIDVEPDLRLVDRRSPDPPLGFEKLLTLMPALRDQVSTLAGARAAFTWFVRMDPQIADAHGAPAWLASAYERELTALRYDGDELGLHTHSWRWKGQWVSDQADAAWVAHCIDVGLGAYAEAFGEPRPAYRHGDHFMSTAVARQLEDRGVAVDLTVEPGLPAARGASSTEESTGWLPDTTTVPTHAYRLSRDDFRVPAVSRAQGLVLVPLTPGVSVRRYRAEDDRCIFAGSYTTLTLWSEPQRFRDLLRWRLAAPGLTHLAFAIRSDIALLPDAWAALEVNVAELGQQLHDQHRWHTASSAAHLLATRLPESRMASEELGDAEVDVRRWLRGSDDPGFRERIHPNAIDGGDGQAGAAVSRAPTPTARTSVILPVYKASGHLSHAVDSVIGQVRPPEELIVVNDGWTDAQLDFLDSVSAPFPIHVVHQANSGQSAARNFGARVARGELLAFLDQDDVWHPRHLEALCRPFLTDSTTVWSYSDFDEIDTDGHTVTRSFLREHSIEHPKMSLSACLDRDLMVVPSASVIRRDAFDTLGGFDQTLWGYEDDDLYLRAFRSGYRFVFQPESLTSFRVHRESASASSRFVKSRLRFSAKLEETIADDRRSNRYYVRDVVAPRFFDTSLDDYVRAVSERDWVAAKGALVALRHFAGLRRRKVRCRMALVRSPRLFWWMLRVNDALPRRLRVCKNPLVHL